MPRFAFQHEFDHEETYIGEKSDPDTALVTLDPHLPWGIRVELARLIIAALEEMNPTLVTDEKLDKMGENA